MELIDEAVRRFGVDGTDRRLRTEIQSYLSGDFRAKDVRTELIRRMTIAMLEPERLKDRGSMRAVIHTILDNVEGFEFDDVEYADVFLRLCLVCLTETPCTNYSDLYMTWSEVIDEYTERHDPDTDFLKVILRKG